MGEFRRSLKNLDVLQKVKGEDVPKWWTTLLALWRPSGSSAFGPPCGTDLRLAVRDGYLNFYRLGQSVAKVHIDSRGLPVAQTHRKYLGLGSAGKNEDYVCLRGCEGEVQVEWKHHGERKSSPYSRMPGVLDWIRTINDGPSGRSRAGYAGAEKILVDKLVSHNASIIDLEIGLPRRSTNEIPQRVDLVMLEGTRIVFWEAKLESDGRVRCEGDRPKVLDQIDGYRDYFSDPARRSAIETGYRDAARILCDIAGLPGVNRDFPLGSTIAEAAKASSLTLSDDVCLVVFDEQRSVSWRTHAEKINNPAGVPLARMLVLPGPDGSYRLEPVQGP